MKITTSLFGEIDFLQYQAKSPITERMEWRTKVITASDGGEERWENRSVPRCTFNYQIPLNSTTKREAYNVMKAGKDFLWYFPLWTEMQSVGTVSSADTNIVCNTINYSFYGDSLAMLYNGADFEIVEIETVNALSVDLYDAPDNTIQGAYLLPIKRGYLNSNPKPTENGLESTLALSFIIQDDVTKTTSTPPQLDDHDVYYDLPFESPGGFFTRDIRSDKQFVDFKLGKLASKTSWDETKQIIPIKFTFYDQEDVSDYKKFFYRRAGKYRDFFTFVQSSDLEVLSTGAIGYYMNVTSDSLADYTAVGSRVVVTDRDGFHYPLEIFNFTQVSADVVQLTFNTSLGLDASDIQLMSWLSRYRLSTDTVTIKWPGSGVAEFSAGMLELEST